MTDHADSPYFTDSELKARWQCSDMTLWRWREKGRLANPIKLAGARGPNLTTKEDAYALEAAAKAGE